MEKLKIKNSALDVLVRATTIDLTFERSRVRNAFVKLVKPHLEKRDADRIKVLEDLAEKDEAKKPIIEAGQYKLTDDNKKKFQEEFIKLSETIAEIEIPEEVKKTLGQIKGIITESTQPIPQQESLILEEIVDAIDAIK